jgi:hypothetical protein
MTTEPSASDAALAGSGIACVVGPANMTKVADVLALCGVERDRGSALCELSISAKIDAATAAFRRARL